MNLEAVAGRHARASRIPLLAPLAGRDFRLVWFGESVSLLGDGFQLVAVSTLVLGMTGSGLALGAILLAAAGAVVDVSATAMFVLAGLLVIAAGAIGIASGLPRRMV